MRNAEFRILHAQFCIVFMEVALLVLRVITIVSLYAFFGVIVILLWRDVRSAARRESPAARERPARLVVIEGVASTASGTTYSLQPFTSIGRAPTNAIELADSYCSAEHALVLWRDGQWWLEDRDSRNGTRLNGETIDSPVVLSAGDLIHIGRAQMRFEVGAASNIQIQEQ
jgi:hypothetical protein